MQFIEHWYFSFVSTRIKENKCRYTRRRSCWIRNLEKKFREAKINKKISWSGEEEEKKYWSEVVNEVWRFLWHRSYFYGNFFSNPLLDFNVKATKKSKTRVLELGGSEKVPLGYTDVFFSLDCWFLILWWEDKRKSLLLHRFCPKTEPAKGGEWKNLEQTSPCDAGWCRWGT